MYSLIGFILVLIGFILSLQYFSIAKQTIGWGLTSIGMLFVFISALVSSSTIFAIVSGILLVGDILFFIDRYAIYREKNEKSAK